MAVADSSPVAHVFRLQGWTTPWLAPTPVPARWAHAASYVFLAEHLPAAVTLRGVSESPVDPDEAATMYAAIRAFEEEAALWLDLGDLAWELDTELVHGFHATATLADVTAALEWDGFRVIDTDARFRDQGASIQGDAATRYAAIVTHCLTSASLASALETDRATTCRGSWAAARCAYDGMTSEAAAPFLAALAEKARS